MDRNGREAEAVRGRGKWRRSDSIVDCGCSIGIGDEAFAALTVCW